MKWLVALLILVNLAVMIALGRAPDAAVAPPLPTLGTRLILLEELNFVERDALLKQPSSASSASQAVEGATDTFDLMRQPLTLVDETPEEAVCFVIEVSDQAAAEAILARLQAEGLSAVLESHLDERPGSLMVYVVPFGSELEARNATTAIRQAGYDSFVIQDGDYINGVSVGVFGSDQNALVRQRQIELLGYRVATHRYQIETVRYSIVARYPDSNRFPQAITALLGQEFSSLQPNQKSCSEVASQHNFL